MKTKILTIALSLVTVLAFAQKREIRNAEDAVEECNLSQAKSLLSQVESQIPSERDKTKIDYYLVKAQAFLGAKCGKNASTEDLMIAAEAYKKLKELGEVEAANNGILAVRNALINAAIADQKKEDYKAASAKLYKSYQLGKQDTIYLYNAATNAYVGKDYNSALKYYKKLLELGYDGAEVRYMATSNETGKIKTFSNKNQRDLFVKMGQFKNPSKEKTGSKTDEIVKSIAIIYIEQDKPNLAKKALDRAIKNNPDDLSLLQAKANIYYQKGEISKYNQLMKEIVKKDPENANLYYNLGVSSAELGDAEGAVAYYKKAVRHDPEMANAYINLAITILKGESVLLEEMNTALAEGNNAKYDELAAKRKALYTEALPYLEKAHQLKPENVEVMRTMTNIYYVLGKDEAAKEMQAKMDALAK